MTNHPTNNPVARTRAFTLIELLVVIGIIAILAAITVPAIKSLSKSNDTSQAANLIRTMISAARATAVSQHRMAGVVFFEETSTFSRPVHSGRTAMELFVESYTQNNLNTGQKLFISTSSDRQYLPSGVSLAGLTDTALITLGDANNNNLRTRAILFDANGQLLLRGGLTSPDPAGPPASTAGQYPMAYGDWNFLRPAGGATPAGGTVAVSAPGFFLFSTSDYASQSFSNDNQRADWLRQHADVVIVNGYTGNVIR